MPKNGPPIKGPLKKGPPQKTEEKERGGGKRRRKEEKERGGRPANSCSGTEFGLCALRSTVSTSYRLFFLAMGRETEKDLALAPWSNAPALRPAALWFMGAVVGLWASLCAN
jgi:hypothetical protein